MNTFLFRGKEHSKETKKLEERDDDRFVSQVSGLGCYRVTVTCSVLQCVAVCCSVLQGAVGYTEL